VCQYLAIFATIKQMRISIIAHPNSKNPRINKDLFGTLHIYVNQPALESRANEAVIESLAEYFDIKKSQVQLIYGQKSKHKRFEILDK
jgi:uncharacterized protein